MASKNLGAVIQRAISDGAFRRQLQSDPAAALRGFNLTPDEIAAIRSGDSSKLISLGVDQRMSKAFAASGFLGASRSTISDLGAGGSASTLANDPTAGAREGIVGDPTWGLRGALATGTTSGTRAVNDVAPFEGNENGLADPTAAGTRAVHDSEPLNLGSAASTGDLSGTRAVHDSAPLAGDPAIDDNIAAAAAGRSGSLAGDMSGTASTEAVRAVNDVAPFEGNALSANDDGTLVSHMADAGTADAVRAINDVEPFEGDANAAAPSDEFLGGDARLDPGIDSSHDFVPSDSADVERELLDHGNALGNTGGGGNTST